MFYPNDSETTAWRGSYIHDHVKLPVEHVFGGQSLCLRDVPDLVVLGRSRVQRPAQEQLSHNASQRPHIDRLAER